MCRVEGKQRGGRKRDYGVLHHQLAGGGGGGVERVDVVDELVPVVVLGDALDVGEVSPGQHKDVGGVVHRLWLEPAGPVSEVSPDLLRLPVSNVEREGGGRIDVLVEQ